jgi:hypothetical protein
MYGSSPFASAPYGSFFVLVGQSFQGYVVLQDGPLYSVTVTAAPCQDYAVALADSPGFTVRLTDSPSPNHTVTLADSPVYTVTLTDSSGALA